MLLSEPGGVSGRRRISIRLTKFPETPPDTFGGFFCGYRFQDLQATGFSGGPFLLETVGESRFFRVSVMEDCMLKSISEGNR